MGKLSGHDVNELAIVGGSLEEVASLWLYGAEFGVDPSKVKMFILNLNEVELHRIMNEEFKLFFPKLGGSDLISLKIQAALKAGFIVQTQTETDPDYDGDIIGHFRFTKKIYNSMIPICHDVRIPLDRVLKGPVWRVVVNNVLMHFSSDERSTILKNLAEILESGGEIHFERGTLGLANPWRENYESWFSHDHFETLGFRRKSAYPNISKTLVKIGDCISKLTTKTY